MKHFTISFPPRTSLFYLTILSAAITLTALGAHAQAPSAADAFQRISFKAIQPCVVGTSGEVTALIKNGVELSVTEDWDCDGIADAYDNCVGMPDPTQIDSDGNGIGDICEAATTVRTGVPLNSRSVVKTESRKERSVDRRSRSNVRTRRNRSGRAKPAEAKVRSRKPLVDSGRRQHLAKLFKA